MKHPRKLGLDQGSTEYVIQDALYRKSRGKRLASTYGHVRNPRLAHIAAMIDWCERPVVGFSHPTPQIISVLEFGGEVTESSVPSSRLEVGATLSLTTNGLGGIEVFSFTVTGKVPHIGSGSDFFSPVVFCGKGSSSRWLEYGDEVVVVGLLDDSGFAVVSAELPGSNYFDRCERASHLLSMI